MNASQLSELALGFAAEPENIDEKGCVNWDFVSARMRNALLSAHTLNEDNDWQSEMVAVALQSAAHIEKLTTAGQMIVQYWCDHEYMVPSKVIEAQKLFGYETSERGEAE